MISSDFAEILGLLCSEGCHTVSFSSYWGKDRGRPRYFRNNKSERIELYNKDIKLLKRYQSLLKSVFGYTTQITKYNKVIICKIDIIREILSKTPIGHMNWKVPDEVKKGCNAVKSGFVRGFFDGDGTASRGLRMFSTNQQGLLQISSLLKNLNIRHTHQNPQYKVGRKPLYTLYIREKDRETFLNLIQPVSKIPGIMRGSQS